MTDVQIYRYPIFEDEDLLKSVVEGEVGEVDIEMPTGATLLGIKVSSKGPVLYAAIDVDEPGVVDRHFVIAGNGHTLPNVLSTFEAKEMYVDTVKIPNGPTFHIFEVMKATA
jgi:hypothetical protein